LYGTWALLPPEDQQRIQGFVLNKFRGDASLLAPAPEMLQNLTGVPTVAVLPMWWQHGLPEEDGFFNHRSDAMTSARASGAVTKTLAVIAYPRISNLDEFQPLHNVPGVRLMWARNPDDLAGLQTADWVILPGSKNTSADLAWLRQQGLDAAVARHAAQGGAVLGICGGLQMLGEALIDTHGIDGNAPGLGLLPLVTQFAQDKTVSKTGAQFGPVSGPWSALSGVHLAGYEIHHGQTQGHSAMLAGGAVLHEVIPGLAWQNGQGQVLGTYLHGLFESPAVLQALFGAQVPTLETVFDGLADFIEQHFEADVLRRLIEPAHRV
jgi:adenosylcobyric acid synthase